MKARQHRKTVQHGMRQWIASGRWRHRNSRYFMSVHSDESLATLRRKYLQPQHAGVRSKFTLAEILDLRKEMCDRGESFMLITCADLSALKSRPFERFQYQEVVFDESTDLLPLAQPRTTHYLKSLITKDHT